MGACVLQALNKAAIASCKEEQTYQRQLMKRVHDDAAGGDH